MKKIIYRTPNIFEVRAKLCYQDQRNPYYYEYYEYDDTEELCGTITCHCSNCINGKSDLANYILELLNE